MIAQFCCKIRALSILPMMAATISHPGERRMVMSPGRKDKAPKEPKKKPKLTIKEKRKLKKEKEIK
jgi:hypothetical protein